MNDQTKFSDGFYTLDGEIEIVAAAKAGNLPQVIKTLERCEYDPDVCQMVLHTAAARGQVEIIDHLNEWDQENILTWDRGIAGLIISEKLDMIKRIINKRKFQIKLEIYISPLHSLACKTKDPAIKDYFQNLEREIDEHERKTKLSKTKSRSKEFRLREAMDSGDLKRVKFLLRNTKYSQGTLMDAVLLAALNGQTEIIEILEDWEGNSIVLWDIVIMGLAWSKDRSSVPRLLEKYHKILDMDKLLAQMKENVYMSKQPEILEGFESYLRESYTRQWEIRSIQEDKDSV